MTFSPETKRKIKQFAKNEARHYLDEAQLTYAEKLRRDVGRLKSEFTSSVDKFKLRSEAHLEAQNDMALYMNDYMRDLVAEGLSEQEAFERARAELKFRSESPRATDLQARLQRYYETRDPAVYEIIGLFYGGFFILGSSIGGLAGYLTSGGRTMLLSGGWIDTLIGTVIGAAFGIALGLISNAIFVSRSK